MCYFADQIHEVERSTVFLLYIALSFVSFFLWSVLSSTRQPAVAVVYDVHSPLFGAINRRKATKDKKKKKGRPTCLLAFCTFLRARSEMKPKQQCSSHAWEEN